MSLPSGTSDARAVLAMESLFPHTVSFDHFEPELYTEKADASDALVSDGVLARFGEHIPLVSSALQFFHELSGNQEALERARKSDPLGRDGFLVHAAEHVPLMNSIMQTVYQVGEDEESLQRARERNPIGSHGYVTRALEHIPLVNDGMVALHLHSGDDVAAERARGYSLQRLFSRDGAVTRVAELLPGSNLLAAVMHKMNGDTERMSRALNLFESWGTVSNPDSGLWQIAELLPGADAVAFAVHLQSGHYAQALRSLTKTSWVNVRMNEVIFCIRCNSLSELRCDQVDFLQVDVIPRQFSLVVGMSDLATNFLQTDREGQRRNIKDPAPQMTAMATLSKDLVKNVADEILALRIAYFTRMVPTYVDWIVEFLNDYLFPKYRQESISWRLLSPRVLPRFSDKEKEETQRVFPKITAQHRSLDAPEPIRLQPRPMPLASASCWSFATIAGVCGLTKVAAGACAAGCLAGATQLCHSVVRNVIDSIGHGNTRRWSSVVVAPQPPQPPQHTASPSGSSSSDPPTLHEGPKEGTKEVGAGYGTVLELPKAEVDSLSPYACDYVLRAVLYRRRSSWRSAIWQMLGRQWLMSAVHSAIEEGQLLPLVLPLDLDPWEVELDGYSFNLQMPSMRFAVVFHVEFSGTGCRFVRAFAAFPDELVQNLSRSLQEQMQHWDLREMDPRLAGFTQSARVGFDLAVDWTSDKELRFVAKGLNSRLDLPAS